MRIHLTVLAYRLSLIANRLSFWRYAICDMRYASKYLVIAACSILGILLLLGFPLQAQPKTVFGPRELGPFIEGDEVPPQNLVILLKGATTGPKGSIWYDYYKDVIIPEMERATNGLMKVRMYGGGMMGEEADAIRKMKMGQLHAVGITVMGLTMVLPEICVFELPFLFDWEPDLYYGGKYCQIDYILEKLEPTLARSLEKRGFQFLGFTESSVCAITSQFPIKRVEDFVRLKFWCWRGDRIRPEINRVFGFRKIVSLEPFDVAAMLSTGMVDSSVAAWYLTVILQWWPHVKYVTDYPLYGYEGATVIFDKDVLVQVLAFVDKWGQRYGLGDGRDVVRKILEINDRGLREVRFGARRNEVKAREDLIRRGAVTEVHFPEPELEKLRQKILPLYDKLADKKYPGWLLDEILEYRQEYRRLKADGRLTDDWYERGIIPDGDQRDQWRTQW